LHSTIIVSNGKRVEMERESTKFEISSACVENGKDDDEGGIPCLLPPHI
jgi:hypothetical protein